jgi:DNA-directed RNA polymerase subunit RPC12/RpoP
MIEELSKLAFFTTPEWRELEKEKPSLIVPEFANSKGHYFMRKKGSNFIYQIIEGECRCTNCGSPILFTERIHSSLDTKFEIAEEHYKYHIEKVPYCPKCEKLPASNVPLTL